MLSLVLINGRPGAGKTTLAAKLTDDLHLPLMGKDMLKEFLADILGAADRADSNLLGKASVTMLYVLAEEYLAAGKSIIIENAFYKEFAVNDLKAILAKHPAHVLEIYCQTDEVVLQARIEDRLANAQRHMVHYDVARSVADDLEGVIPSARYAPLEIGDLIRVDTTHFGDAEYQALLVEIRKKLV